MTDWYFWRWSEQTYVQELHVEAETEEEARRLIEEGEAGEVTYEDYKSHDDEGPLNLLASGHDALVMYAARLGETVELLREQSLDGQNDISTPR